MAKLAVWTFLAFLVEVSLAGPLTVSSEYVHLQHKLVKDRDLALRSIENLNLDNVEKRRAIVADASEFSFKIEKAVNRIFQNFVRVNEKENGLPQLALRLNNIVHQVQDVLITNPTNLKTILKEDVHQVYIIAERFRQILQHLEGSADEDVMREDLREIIRKLADALRQLQSRDELHREVQKPSNGTSHPNFGNQIMSSLREILSKDQFTHEQLAKAAEGFSNSLSRTVERMRGEFAHFQVYDRKMFSEVFEGLKKIDSDLKDVLKDDVGHAIEVIISQMQLAVRDFDIQIQKLLAIGKEYEDDNLHAALVDCVKNVIADGVRAEQQMLATLSEIVNKPAE